MAGTRIQLFQPALPRFGTLRLDEQNCYIGLRVLDRSLDTVDTGFDLRGIQLIVKLDAQCREDLGHSYLNGQNAVRGAHVRIFSGDAHNRIAHMLMCRFPLATPAQVRSTYRPLKEKTRISGSISNRGISSVNALGTPLGRYEKVLKDAIGSRWYAYMEQKRDLASIGTLQVHFLLTVADT